MLEIQQYETVRGRRPLVEWLVKLRDATARARITARLDRLRGGLRGDWKNVRGAVCELRMDHGPGYRVYYVEGRSGFILLLCGGNKRTQAKDIEKAHAYWKDFQERSR
jgi:putative addiction module killer protein